MSDDYISMHKRIAMGQAGAEKHLKKGGTVKGVMGNVLDSSRKSALPAPSGKIATMKRGGGAKRSSGRSR